jgi:molybdate-binding protein
MQAHGGPDAVLIAFARREQGLLLDAASRSVITTLADAVTTGLRIAQRPRGAGAQLLLLALLCREGLSLNSAKRGPLCPTGADVAQAIQAGRADCGIASRAVAASAGLRFVPLQWEQFDLVIGQRDYFTPPMQRLLALARSSRFTERAREMSGYDVSEAGAVRFLA